MHAVWDLLFITIYLSCGHFHGTFNVIIIIYHIMHAYSINNYC